MPTVRTQPPSKLPSCGLPCLTAARLLSTIIPYLHLTGPFFGNLLCLQADDWDIGYINFVCVTGTLQKLLYEEQGGHKWVKLQLSVPTPGSNGFTK